jgi:hypothetical protein
LPLKRQKKNQKKGKKTLKNSEEKKLTQGVAVGHSRPTDTLWVTLVVLFKKIAFLQIFRGIFVFFWILGVFFNF